MFDRLFRNGTVVDGTGAPAFRADVAVQGEKIAAVEPGIDAEKARAVHDISGLYLAPGFIDLHTHSDFPLLLDGRALSAVYQGVTTQVIGNCGFAPAPLRQPEDIRRNVFCFQGPFSPEWRDFGDFLAYFNRIETGTNTAVLAGHGALHSWAAGYENRTATEEELQRIDHQLRTALEAGAFGLSTGLEYAPGSNADPRELHMLCSTVAEYGGLYATHVRNRDEKYRSGYSEAFDTARKTGVRLQISHAVPKYGAPDIAAHWFLEQLHHEARTGGSLESKAFEGAFEAVFEAASEAAEKGTAADVIPYEWGPTSLSAILPKELLQFSPSEIAVQLGSAEVRSRVINQERPFWLHFRDQLWDQILLYHSVKFPELVGRNGYEIGDYFKTDPFNGLLSILEEEGASMFSVLMMGKIKRRDHLDLIIRDPLVGVISDAMSLAVEGPLASVIWSPGCYGWVPRFFNEFVGEGKALTLEEGTYKITGFPARRLGLKDRGVIRAGAAADIVIFDPAKLEERASMQEPRQYAGGFTQVLCNGVPTLKEGSCTGSLPGRLLRRR